MSVDLRTDDEIARLFAAANPVIETDHPRAADRSTSGDTTIDLEQSSRSTGPAGRRRAWVLAAAAAAAVVVAGVIMMVRGDDRAPADEIDTTVPDLTTPPLLDDPNPEPVRSLVGAFNARDADAMRATLAESADPAAAAAIDDLVGALEWYDAFGWRWTDVECRSPAIDALGCDIVVENRLTEYAGTPRYLQLGVTTTGGLIQTLTESEDFDEYSTVAFEPFVEYVAATHPDDVGLMWSRDDGGGVSPVTERSDLFDAHLTEYTADAEPPTPLHRRFLGAHGQPADERPDVTGMFAPDGTTAGAWADDPASYAAALDVLAAWEFDWGVGSCEPDVGARPLRIRCFTDPTTAFDAVGIDIPFRTVVFEMSPAGISRFEAYGLAGVFDDALQPFYDWVAAEHPDDVATVLEPNGGGWSAVMDEGTAPRLGVLAAEYVEHVAGDDGG